MPFFPDWPPDFGRVAGFDGAQTVGGSLVTLSNQVVIATGPTTTGSTSNPGVDYLSFRVHDTGLYLVNTYLGVVTGGNAATSHTANCLMNYANGAKDTTAQYVGTSTEQVQSDVASVDMKTAGADLLQSASVVVSASNLITIYVRHTVTGSETTAPTYIVAMSVVRV